MTGAKGTASTSLRLPPSPDRLARASWADIAPLYKSLAERNLTPENAPAWLSDWTRLEDLVTEAAALAAIAYTSDTGDKDKEAAHLRFAAEISPRQHEAQVGLARKLLQSGYSRDDLQTTLRRFQIDAEIFREENIPLFERLEVLEAEYNRITGSMTVDWDGKRLTVPQLQPFLKEQDRAVRERAFRLAAQPYLSHRSRMASLFTELRSLRNSVANNAGFPSFLEYAFAAKHRFDYTPDDCRRFHDAVEEAVVPVVERLFKTRQAALGVPTLRPWDISMNVGLKHALTPFRDADEFVRVARRVFHGVDPELGTRFDTMADESLLDLESREGKAPGGYCTSLPYRQRPFVFMNAVGVPDDVNTLIHEAGHCFHDFELYNLPWFCHREIGMEAAELASMSMELLAAPHLARPTGYYSESDSVHALLEHLEEIPRSLAHIASVDAFQHWIYTDERGADAEARDREWLSIRARFERGVDWSGLEQERVARWYRQAHIFVVPFYYIEYGIAQLGALQVWRNSMRDYKDAVSRYKNALSLGATRGLHEIYQAAGARIIFDAAGMAELMELVEEKVEELRGGNATA